MNRKNNGMSNDPRTEPPLPTTPARPIAVLRNAGELDPLGVRDLIGRHDRQLEKTLGILGLFKELGGHSTGRRARPRIGQRTFQSIARMNSDLSLLKGQRDQGAVVFPFSAKLPCFGVPLGKTEHVLSFCGLHGQHFHLRRGFLFEFAKPALQLPLDSGIDDSGVVHDVGAGVRHKHLAPTQSGQAQQNHDGEHGFHAHGRHQRSAKVFNPSISS